MDFLHLPVKIAVNNEMCRTSTHRSLVLLNPYKNLTDPESQPQKDLRLFRFVLPSNHYNGTWMRSSL